MRPATAAEIATLPPAPADEAWLRGAATIDGAFAAAEALNRQLLSKLGDDDARATDTVPAPARIATDGRSLSVAGGTDQLPGGPSLDGKVERRATARQLSSVARDA